MVSSGKPYCTRHPFIFRNTYAACARRRELRETSIHWRKSTIYLSAPRMFRSCRIQKYYSSTCRASWTLRRSQRKVPSPVSGIICRHISAGHLNCNARFPCLSTARRGAARRTTSRRTNIIQISFGTFNTRSICGRSRAFDMHKKKLLQRINDQNMFSVRLVYIDAFMRARPTSAFSPCPRHKIKPHSVIFPPSSIWRRDHIEDSSKDIFELFANDLIRKYFRKIIM